MTTRDRVAQVRRLYDRWMLAEQRAEARAALERLLEAYGPTESNLLISAQVRNWLEEHGG